MAIEHGKVALLAEGVDRNSFAGTLSSVMRVALLAEGVDRNSTYSSPRKWAETVALLAEGVDRNLLARLNAQRHPVALLAEGVDRNLRQKSIGPSRTTSPSSRRAWIEMDQGVLVGVALESSPSSRRAWIEICCRHGTRRARRRVALLAEGVDRNHRAAGGGLRDFWSPSSRRAWIEIPT